VPTVSRTGSRTVLERRPIARTARLAPLRTTLRQDTVMPGNTEAPPMLEEAKKA